MNSFFKLLAVSVFLSIAHGQYSNRRHLRVVTLVTPRSQLVTQSADGTLGGFIIELLNLIAPLAGFTYSITVLPGFSYGSLQPDGSWSGVVGALLTNQADLAAIDLTITAARDAVIDYTTPFAQSPLKILTNVEYGLNNVHYLVVDGTSFVDILRGSTVPVVQAIWADIQANNGLVSGTDNDDVIAVDRVLAGGFAYISDLISALPFVNENPGRLRFNGTCDDILSNTYLAFGVQQGSPLRKQISAAMSKINEMGQLESMLVKYRLV